MELVGLVRLQCKRCGHTWVPRVLKPELCPRCKSHDWNKEVKDVVKQSKSTTK